jgi:predicted permease
MDRPSRSAQPSEADRRHSFPRSVPFSLLFQFTSLLVGQLSHLAGLPQHFVPLFVFNNVTSLPLLLISTLSSAGALDALVPPGGELDQTLSKLRVYILINALVGNLTRFAIGSFLMVNHDHVLWMAPHRDDPAHRDTPKSGDNQIRLPVDNQEPDDSKKTVGQKALKAAQLGWHYLSVALNPPLVGGLAAIAFGLIPFAQSQLFSSSGWLSPIADAIKNIGGLYTVMQMLVLGAHLYSKGGGRAPTWSTLWLFAYRFFLAPALSIGVVGLLQRYAPGVLGNDEKAFRFVLMIGNVGPPALTLSAIAEMSDLPEETEGEVSQVLLLSYAATPLIALSITAALEVVQWGN